MTEAEERLTRERDEARRMASMYARLVSRMLALENNKEPGPAQPPTPCSECSLRDADGGCDAQCVAYEGVARTLGKALGELEELLEKLERTGSVSTPAPKLTLLKGTP